MFLEKDPDDEETLHTVFRLAHTIKGSSKMMKLNVISETSHRLEDVMDALRQKRIELSGDLFDLLYEAIDALDAMLDQVSKGEELEEIPVELCDNLSQASQGGSFSTTRTVQSFEPEKSGIDETLPAQEEGERKGEDTRETPDAEVGQPFLQPEKSTVAGEAEEEVAGERTEPEQTSAKKSGFSADTIRISSDKLDNLIKLMGEIVSGHSRAKQRYLQMQRIEKISLKNMELLSMLENLPDGKIDIKGEISKTARSLNSEIVRLNAGFKEDINIDNLLISDLQDTSLKMRMRPLSTIFETFRKTVRNLSRNSDKEIDFLIEGQETELDKKIIEKIGDPLIQMIRNSIEHGIESVEQRKEENKPPRGEIRLVAGYEGGNVLIELSDDGAGIQVEKLKQKALKKKLIDESEFQALSRRDAVNLIFSPGMSTTDIITDLSGRGVGMDVVRKNIVEDLKGSIHIESEEGRGTRFYVRLPLTMAVVHVFFITVSQMVFAVPAGNIEEIIKTESSETISVANRRAIRLRDQIIPIINLSRVLNLPGAKEKKDSEDDGLLILVATTGNEKLGLIIDALLNEEDMVIKSLPSHMENVPFVSGCIISGKNEIFNVLHLPRIISAAKEKGEPRKRETVLELEEERRTHILLVDDSASTREIEKSILESYGYTVTMANDGMEGLEMANDIQFDLVITDIEMPRLDGFSLTQRLRDTKNYKDTPIILVTSLDKEEDKKKGIQAGADAYIVKGGFDQATLLESIRNLVG
jgi:chemotaxis protein histidine kinase CheA